MTTARAASSRLRASPARSPGARRAARQAAATASSASRSAARAASASGRDRGQRLGLPRRARVRHRRAGPGPRPRAPPPARRRPSGALLLLRLGREAARLGSQLVQEVPDPLQVRLRLGELGLGGAPTPLVLADAGRLLEQRPPLLGAQRERLVDHALADEQERVVGQVRLVEQVDEVAQPDALAVEQELVLARAEEPPAQLDLAEVDRQQPVLVVEDERDVGHAHAPGASTTRRR